MLCPHQWLQCGQVVKSAIGALQRHAPIVAAACGAAAAAAWALPARANANLKVDIDYFVVPKPQPSQSDDSTRLKSFGEQGFEAVTAAVAFDHEGNYEKAFELYVAALEHFALYCEDEKNPAIKEAVYSKMREYRRRAEYLKTAIEQPSQWDDSTRLKSFKEQGIETVTAAVAFDHEGNYKKAIELYVAALEQFALYCKYEKNPANKEVVYFKMCEYCCRAEYLKAVIEQTKHST